MPASTAATVTRFAPGEEAPVGHFKPGDFILTHSNAFFSRLIRFGQGLRYWGKDRKYTRWSHAALIASEAGDLIEALNDGVVATHITHYKPTEYHLVHINDSVADA